LFIKKTMIDKALKTNVMDINIIKIAFPKNFGVWVFLSTLVAVMGISINTIIVEKEKLDRIEKFQRMGMPKIEAIGSYEGKTDKETSYKFIFV